MFRSSASAATTERGFLLAIILLSLCKYVEDPAHFKGFPSIMIWLPYQYKQLPQYEYLSTHKSHASLSYTMQERTIDQEETPQLQPSLCVQQYLTITIISHMAISQSVLSHHHHEQENLSIRTPENTSLDLIEHKVIHATGICNLCDNLYYTLLENVFPHGNWQKTSTYMHL